MAQRQLWRRKLSSYPNAFSPTLPSFYLSLRYFSTAPRGWTGLKNHTLKRIPQRKLNRHLSQEVQVRTLEKKRRHRQRLTRSSQASELPEWKILGAEKARQHTNSLTLTHIYTLHPLTHNPLSRTTLGFCFVNHNALWAGLRKRGNTQHDTSIPSVHPGAPALVHEGY